MRQKINARSIGLHHSVQLETEGKNGFVIVMDRKSRIIMKDGHAILKKAETIKKSCPEAKVTVETTAPVCSKTKAFLSENDIVISQI